MNDDATINANGGQYEGLDRYEARKQIVKDLEDGGYLIKVEDHAHNVGQCYRCGTTVRANHIKAVVRQNEAAGRRSD